MNVKSCAKTRQSENGCIIDIISLARNEPDDWAYEKFRPFFAKFIFLYLIDTSFYVKMVDFFLFPAKVLILTSNNSLLWQEFLRGYIGHKRGR